MNINHIGQSIDPESMNSGLQRIPRDRAPVFIMRKSTHEIKLPQGKFLGPIGAKPFPPGKPGSTSQGFMT
jgi:hypothetical protein